MKKVFSVLGVAVVAIILIAATVNIFVPNATAYIVGTIEEAIVKSTGFEMDFNGDGVTGPPASAVQSGTGDASYTGAGVEGFN